MIATKKWILIFIVFLCSTKISAQSTEIKGFANIDARYTQNESNTMFYLGEQDLFITSRVADRISFLGETVFKYSSGSPTSFDVSVERMIVNYNFAGNHSILLGKHHTPISYWNDKYHHGRVFFPTVDRPLIFRQNLIAIHTTGIALQGLNLGKYNLGYQIMVGNGIGSTDFADDNKYKSVTIEAHAKPVKGMKFGLTGYMDKFASNAMMAHGTTMPPDTGMIFNIFQLAGGAYFSYFKHKYEFLTEAHLITNRNDSVGLTKNTSFYAYGGYRLTEKLVPYAKIDVLAMDKKEIFYHTTVKQMLSLGLRYEFSYLAIAKLEYNRSVSKSGKVINGVYMQFAVGF